MLVSEELKNSIAIAEFCGFKEVTVHVTDTYGYHQAEKGFEVCGIINTDKHISDDEYDHFHTHDLKFYSDWNWIALALKHIYKKRLDAPHRVEEEVSFLYSEINRHLGGLESQKDVITTIMDFINFYEENVNLVK